jgi:beta-lactam-binding protein with PASTA domain
MAPANGATSVVVSSDPSAGTSTEVTTTIELTVSAKP